LFANQGGDIRKSLHSIAAARNEPAAVTTNVGECAKAIVSVRKAIRRSQQRRRARRTGMMGLTFGNENFD
jgi:hypothetical protein